MFSKKMLEFLLILNVNMVKPAHETREILLYRAAFLCVWKKVIELVGQIKYAFV